MSKLSNKIGLVFLSVTSLSISAAFVEIGFRLIYLPNPLHFGNFATSPINQQISGFTIIPDERLGYIPQPFKQLGTMSHGPMGIRLNHTPQVSEKQLKLQKNGILAVGDSFTFGSEVSDAESWPAQLEQRLGIPVINAGVPGYGVDQAVLRATSLLEDLEPRLLIVSMIPNCIGRNEYSVNTGLNKPYFDVSENQLQLKNIPVPRISRPVSEVGVVRTLFGYFYGVYWVADRIGMGGSWTIFNGDTNIVHEKGLEVTCLLWERIGKIGAARNIPVVAFVQYSGMQVSGEDDSRLYHRVEQSNACATAAGLLVVDSFGALKRRLQDNTRHFWKLWVRQSHDVDKHTGHMSALGNAFSAELLADALQSEYPDIVN